MKKTALILACLFSCMLLLGGCKTNTAFDIVENDVSESGADASEPGLTNDSETDEEPSETTEPPYAAEKEEQPLEFSLSDIALSELSNTFLNFSENYYLDKYCDNRFFDFNLGSCSLRCADDELFITNPTLVRESTRKLALSDKEKLDFISAVSEKAYKRADETERALEFIDDGYIAVHTDRVQKSDSEITVTADNASCGYTLNGKFTPNAFVSKDDEGIIQFIIDPAYMIGIPLIGKNPEHYTFDINGTEVMMDSLLCRSGNASHFPEIFQNRGNEYFYAKVELDYIRVEYDFKSGYNCRAVLGSIEPVNDDALSVITAPIADFFEASEEKPAEMTEAYNAITENYDELCKPSTRGIVLLDLDFDGKAELLVSDVEVTEDESFYEPHIDVTVSVYRIENGGLTYIDSFPCDEKVVYDTQMLLGLKTLPDGSKGWFTTYNGDGFIYKLKGSGLERTEIFSRKETGFELDQNGREIPTYSYYFMGEEIIPTVIHEEVTEPMDSDTHYEWNGSYSYFGVMWELYGHIREDYCADIEESFILYSDWLTENIAEQLTVTPREASYNIAYLVDSFYLGDYNPASRTFNYRFLGDYAKPVIYLYPEEETDVTVKVGFAEGGALTCSYPEYNGGWSVKAFPDGTLLDENGNEYYCLYWEGKGSAVLDRSKGWCVKGGDTAAFLREKLLEIGLTPREANEFIIYWLPLMQNNPYNIITFHTEDYALSVPIEALPAPDTQIRVFMTFEASEEPAEIPPQQLPHYERNGFTLVEWGGSEIN
ncbi:MAG: hypothetical protein NC394_10700 [Bacteroides sp.]|nr:hypothetical protein [Bacteroides sp.]